MTHTRRILRAVVAVGGLATAATLLVPAATASSEPSGPLVETTYSHGQLEAAMQVETPEAAARLSQHPDAQVKVQELLALPVDQRKQRIQAFLDRNPDVRARIEEKRATPEGQDKIAKLQRIADTCHNY